MPRLEWTFSCHACGEERPDGQIAVWRTDLSDEHGYPPGTILQNVRYCRDRPACAERAQQIRLVALRAVRRA